MYYAKGTRTDQDFVNQYLKEIRDFPQLDKPGERVLLNEYRNTGSKKALDTLTTSNLRFVVSVAIKYQYQGLSMPELINEGNLGLIEGIKRFNPDNYSVKFISYAVWWIRQSIIKALYEKSRLVRVSAEKESKIKKVNRMVEDSLQEFGVIDCAFVAKKTGSKFHEVEQILSLSRNRISMDMQIDSENASDLHDLIEDEHTETPDQFLDTQGIYQMVSEMVDKLTLQEQKVVRFYFGIGQEASCNLEQVGRKMGISKERVRQVKKRALEKIRQDHAAPPLAICA